MNITYNVFMTNSAIRRRADLTKDLFETHRVFDTSIPPGAIKIILRYLDDESHHVYIGGLYRPSGQIGRYYRYMRVVIDIPAGSKTTEEKKTLLNMVSSCCVEYQRDKAETCEIEIKINEVDLDNVILAGKRPVGMDT